MIEKSLKFARASDWKCTRTPRLFGEIIVVKDQILVRHERVEAASLLMCRHVSAFSAEVVNRLRLAGAVVVGVASMDEFGIGFSSVSCIRGPVINA